MFELVFFFYELGKNAKINARIIDYCSKHVRNEILEKKGLLIKSYTLISSINH